MGNKMSEIKEMVNPDRIISMIAEYHGISVQQLMGKKKTRKYSMPKREAIYCLYKYYDLYTLEDIGKLFDQSASAMGRSVKTSEVKMKSVEQFRQRIEFFLNKINESK